MLPEGNPTGRVIQQILYWQNKTMQMMYETIYTALKEVVLKNTYEPQDYLNFFCLGNREEMEIGATPLRSFSDTATSAPALTDTAQRIKAVDRAASMVEEILKQGASQLNSAHDLNTSKGQMIQPFSSCVYLGFDTDPSLNIEARIRGPNDQYINHIMNETGASLILRGSGSGNTGSSQDELTQQPLHLYLSSTNQKSLENARILAEHLLDTICAECGATRNSSCKVYGAVPPPQQLMNGNVLGSNTNLVTGIPSTMAGFVPAPSFVPSSNFSPGNVVQPGGLPSHITIQANTANYTHPVVTVGTCYSGYGGIYPQATALQQVALALRQAPSLTSSVVAPTTEPAGTLPMPTSSSIAENDRRPQQRRKFQELPVTPKEPANRIQNSRQDEFLKPGSVDLNARNISSMPPPKKLCSPSSDGMPPPPPRNMPPPPPKFSSPQSPPKISSTEILPPPPPKFPSKADTKNPATKKSNAEAVPDTLLKLVEYGDEDDDDDIDDREDESSQNHPKPNTASKPFWAV